MSSTPSYHPTMLLVGRIFLAGVFLGAGINKLKAIAGTVGYFTKLGLPMPEIAVYVAMVIEIGGALLLIAGWKTRHVAWVLAIFTLIATFFAHRFWQVDAAQYGNQFNHFFKNFAIIGGLLFVAACGPGRLSVDKS